MATPSLASPDARAGGDVTPQYRRWALGVLTAVYVSNFVDRQILSILLQPIKEAFALSDTQLGFLSGISFALFYATLAPPSTRSRSSASSAPE